MVTMHEVAARAKVSVGVVSRVLSGDPSLRVGEETRERVRQAAQELEYVPSHAARSLRTASAGAIALILPEVTSTIVSDLARSVEDSAREIGTNLLLARTTQLEQDTRWLRGLLASGRVDGALLQVPEGLSAGQIFEMAPTPERVVLINSLSSGQLSTLVLDDVLSMRIAVEHLVELGHSRIGFLGGSSKVPTAKRRHAGFLAALDEFGLQAESENIVSFGFTGKHGRAAVAELVERGNLPTALVVANVDAALGALAELRERGVGVPSDLSVIALHDVWYADATWPPMTTVKAPMKELGRQSVDMLMQRTRGASLEHRVVTEPAFQLIVRESTAPPKTR